MYVYMKKICACGKTLWLNCHYSPERWSHGESRALLLQEPYGTELLTCRIIYTSREGNVASIWDVRRLGSTTYLQIVTLHLRR
jgi:hypothetical protein